jgi:hypothetical protein
MGRIPRWLRLAAKAQQSRDATFQGKVSQAWPGLRLMAIMWTASSDAARQACSKAAVRWGNAQAATATARRGHHRGRPGIRPMVYMLSLRYA